MTKHTPYTVLWIIPYNHAYFSADPTHQVTMRCVFPLPQVWHTPKELIVPNDQAYPVHCLVDYPL